MKKVFTSGLLLACLLIFSSCVLTPASLVPRSERLTSVRPGEKRSLHSLLEAALVTPNEGESAGALALFVSEWRRQQGIAGTGVIEATRTSPDAIRYRVHFIEKGPARYSPGYFDEIRPASSFRVVRLEHHLRPGVGAPLLAVRENLAREVVERYYPPEAITRGVTAVIHPGIVQDGVRDVRVELLDSLYHENVTYGGRRHDLAADHSVALAALLSRAEDLGNSEFSDLLTPMPTREPRLYLMEPYDPRKEPLIMIHGLFDSPLTWAKMTNDLRAVPEITRRYQIWHFLYNTSAPPLYAGRILRAQYRQMRREFDPDLDNPASRRSTLVTHSMGGIVARGLITDPGEAFEKAAFTRPISSLALSPEDRATLLDAFIWEPEPSIKRVVFIAVPHRGSRFADNMIGNLGRRLVEPPAPVREFYLRVSSANPGAFTEPYAALGRGELDSVGSLSPRQPTLQILSDLQVGRGISLHSIIANRGFEGPLEESSDGVVEYWSSHLDGVASEKIVPSGHSAPRHPDTIREVERLLLLP